jgi:hypothetical protein
MIGVCCWLGWVLMTWGKTAPFRRKPEPEAPTPAPAPAPAYVRRWNLHRRAWVIAERRRWQAEFDSLAR